MIVDDFPTTDPGVIASTLFDQMERAWNAGDGAAFGAVFADHTDFVNIRGEHLHGGPALIAAGHQGIFDTIYRGSTNRIQLDRVREVAPGCLLVHATSTLDAPSGPLAGTNQAKMSALLVEHDGTWKAAAFHNTLIRT
jgi:uncharacterized protein (TIGR02246 family)